MTKNQSQWIALLAPVLSSPLSGLAQSLISDRSSLCVRLALLQSYSRLNEITFLAGCFQFFSSPLKSQGFAAAFPVLVEELFQVASSMAQTQEC